MRLIDADALAKWLKSPVGFRSDCEGCTSIDCLDCIIEEAINNAPTINAETVRHGRWEERMDGRYGQRRTYCSACGRHSGIGGNKQEPPYCPNCGAKMNGGK